MDRRNKLHHLLDQSARLGPEYGRGLSSHLPMALCALHALGASDARLGQFFERYAVRFSPPSDPAAAASSGYDWRSELGAFDAFDALAAHFRVALASQGMAATLRESLPVLMTGVAAAAFHGLIRTAYAVEAGHAAELASALAYWAARCLPVRDGAPARKRLDGHVAPEASASKQLDAGAWTERLLAAHTLPRPDGRMITDRVTAVLASPDYLDLAGRLRVDEHTLARLATTAVEAYGASRNFTVLHLVTGCHAMRTVLPWLPDPQTALAQFADAFAAAYLSSGIDSRAPALPSTGRDWPDIVERAIRSDDDHVIKLVHSCRAEAAVYGDAMYVHAAGLTVA